MSDLNLVVLDQASRERAALDRGNIGPTKGKASKEKAYERYLSNNIGEEVARLVNLA
jgi:hypothetical protein